MRLSSCFLPGLVVLALTSAACTSIEIGERSTGDEGNLKFEYSSLSCLFGCSLDRAALVGSKVTISVTQLDPATLYFARLPASAFGTIADQKQDCSCSSESGDTTTSRGLESPAASCQSHETKGCTLRVDVFARDAGESKLEIVTGDRVVDRITVKARPATRIDVKVRVDGNEVEPSGGVYVAPAGSSVALDADVFGETGQLVFMSGGLSLASDNAKIIAPDSTSFSMLGAKAMAAGEVSLTVTATGAEAVAPFRVVQ